MADEEEDVIEQPEIQQDNEPEEEVEEQEQPEEREILTVQIGDEEPEEDPEPEDGPDLVTKLRKLYRDEKKARREAEAKVANTTTQQAVDEELGPEPQESDPGIDYDAKAYRDAWNAWDAQRKQAEARKEREREQAKEADERWQGKLARLEEKKAALKVPDLDEAEDFVRETFNPIQMGVMIQGAEDPALLGYALFKNPKKAKELAAITDYVELAFALARTEAQLKVGTRNSPPPPERRLNGGTGGASSVDNKLEALRAKAEKTGDYTEVAKYRRQQAEKAAKAA
jgi:hypothetical protein